MRSKYTHKKLRAGARAGALCLFLGACASDAPPRAPVEPRAEAAVVSADDPADDPVVAALIDAHNTERAQAGLPALKGNAQLQAAAERQAKDMAAHHNMSHKGSDGSTPETRIKQAGYAFETAAENVAMGQTTPEEAMKTWMDSKPHKRNILGPYTEIGAASAQADDGTTYWAADFGKPWPRLDPADAAHGLVRAINSARAEEDLPALTENSQLGQAAQRQAELMAEQHTFQPKAGDGLTAFERAQRSGLTIRKGGESLASGLPAPKDVVQDWMKRSAQKESMLGSFSQVGAGYATATDGTPYWCVLFVSP